MDAWTYGESRIPTAILNGCTLEAAVFAVVGALIAVVLWWL